MLPHGFLQRYQWRAEYHHHWLLTDVLKGDWQHQGFVVSDLGGVKRMVEGHEQGKMSYADAVSRVARVRMLLGEFDPFSSGPYSKIPITVIDSEAHRAVALKAAQESIVLLKNDGLFPLDKTKLKRIAVIGPLADAALLNNYNGKTSNIVTVPWLKDNVPAVLQAWWGGEEAGHGLADVLFGDVNPAGRLPHTVYASAAQVPPISEYDITKGFTYMYVKGAPLFAFDHGLSYTKFAYDNLKIAGDEVVQLYVHEEKSSVPHPTKELRGFQRLSFQPGEKRTVKFSLPAKKLAFWDEKTHAFLVEAGAYEIMVGASSEDIRVRGNLTVIQ